MQNKNAMDRYSLAMFLDPHPDCKIGPLPMFVKEGVKSNYDACFTGTKGVRFGDPEYLKLVASRA